MSCGLCQYLLNIALALDKLANAILAGSPNETISRRIARAEQAGSKFAIAACRVLSQLQGRDHCGFALSPGTSGREIWKWSDNFSEPSL